MVFCGPPRTYQVPGLLSAVTQLRALTVIAAVHPSFVDSWRPCLDISLVMLLAEEAPIAPIPELLASPRIRLLRANAAWREQMREPKLKPAPQMRMEFV